MLQKIYTFYCSPAGTTRQAAELIHEFFQERGGATIAALGRGREKAALEEMAEFNGRVLVAVGSPVYSSHALPLVMDLINRLPRRDNVYSLPFVTWGGATSGLALEEMGQALGQQGYPVLAAAKLMALHSLMWESTDPVGLGRPDSGDLEQLSELCAWLAAEMPSPAPRLLDPERLAYQDPEAAAGMRQLNLEKARAILPPRRLEADLCSRCGICVESCPVGAMQLDPLPVYDQSCILCFNCMRLCPEAAFKADLGPIHQRVRERAGQYAEAPLTEIFHA